MPEARSLLHARVVRKGRKVFQQNAPRDRVNNEMVNHDEQAIRLVTAEPEENYTHYWAIATDRDSPENSAASFSMPIRCSVDSRCDRSISSQTRFSPRPVRSAATPHLLELEAKAQCVVVSCQLPHDLHQQLVIHLFVSLLKAPTD